MNTCILCGTKHEKGEPCDFRGADSILRGRINIQPLEVIEQEAEEAKIKEITQKLRKKRHDW